MTQLLPPVVVANLHGRYTGVSATVRALVPLQRRRLAIGLIDWGQLGLEAGLAPRHLFLQGWRPPPGAARRVWHARRDLEILVGLLLRGVLRQPWAVLFTSAAPKPPGPVLLWLIRRCDAVIATSGRSAGFLPQDCVSATIPHGVDTHFYSPAPTAPGGEGPPELPALIGCFGRIRPSKGVDLVVEALITLLPDRPSYGAVFTGLVRPAERDFVAGLQRRIAAAGLDQRIRFLGDLDRLAVRGWYRRVCLCVAASRREGFGLTPLEAMACGCAVLTSEAGAWPELVDREVGRRFQTGNLASLTQELARLLDQPDELRAMGRRARRRALARHSVEVEASAINALYRQLLEGAGEAKAPISRRC